MSTVDGDRPVWTGGRRRTARSSARCSCARTATSCRRWSRSTATDADAPSCARRPGASRPARRSSRTGRTRPATWCSARPPSRRTTRLGAVTLTGPWPAGAATGIGSLPGTDIAEAQRDRPRRAARPAAPARAAGPRAGRRHDRPRRRRSWSSCRSSSTPARWRVAAAPGPRPAPHPRPAGTRPRRADRAGRRLRRPGQGAGGRAVDPGRQLDLPIGGRLLRDHGAVRDLADSLAEGLRAARRRRRAAGCPRATVLLQLDEPSLPAVLAGRVPTESGLQRLPARWRRRPRRPRCATVVERGRRAGRSCTAARRTSAAAVPRTPAPPRSSPRPVALVAKLDPLGEALDAGVGLLRRRGADSTGDRSAGVGGPIADRVRRRCGSGSGFPADAAAAAGRRHARLRAGRAPRRTYARGRARGRLPRRPAHAGLPRS